jgi:amino acid transporter
VVERRVSRWVIAAVGVVVLALIAVAAIGARRIPNATSDSQIPLDRGTVGALITYAAWALIVAFAVWLLLPGGGRRRRRPVPKRGSWVAMVVVLLVLFVLFLELGKLGPVHVGQQESVTSLPETRETTRATTEPHVSLPAGSPTTLLLVIAGVALVGGLLATIVRPAEPEAPEEVEAALAGVIGDLIAELEGSGARRQRHGAPKGRSAVRVSGACTSTPGRERAVRQASHRAVRRSPIQPSRDR